MFALLLTLLILDALILSAVVLLQAGQGGGLASLGGATTDTVLGGRQAVTILTKMTWWCGGIFLALALLLSLVPRGGGATELQERLRATSPAAPAPSATLPLGGTPDTALGATAPGATAPGATAPGGAAPTPAPQQKSGQ
jgi:preprotein translocase subunit SecG